ncbi:MAG: glutamine amidotransferase [Gallionellales bacterium RIFCSPLOWO2_12_FULL_59_22]|nr:MAG: glutamine amidotransferase [Gallionellales bacterium RIFCSPLOWO2_02_FULL_59_110]OGT02528.1 MAG: glutamine amidotransferase [Gallionellales bacterium RIFCSPLOWO2_02_58_13]OGT14802.1 MAG: glutamine amidotransferase [Gallionellales bacterium RIFCSPLOWO2_12_FULL_59_22]
MKPVAIFRHAASEGPGYLAGFLDEQHIPWQLIAIDAGAAVPPSAEAYSGLVFMGGPMSVNDDLPWIAPVLALIREAVDRDIPVLGHCLGGQLMSKALGGAVTRNPVKEIGWGEVAVAGNDIARAWFGAARHFNAFHWHGETFSMPQGAALLLSSAYCANQAWGIGKHLALQCHVEMTGAMIVSWCEIGAEEIAAHCTSPAVQNTVEMQRQMAGELPHLHEIAARLYTRWIGGLRDTG